MSLRIERDMIPVRTISLVDYVPDPDWRFTDAAGHEHRWVDGQIPTTEWIVAERWFCHDCHDEHTEEERRCRLCREEIQPHFLEVPAPTRIIGQTHYFVDGAEVSEAEAKDWIERMEQRRAQPTA